MTMKSPNEGDEQVAFLTIRSLDDSHDPPAERTTTLHAPLCNFQEAALYIVAGSEAEGYTVYRNGVQVPCSTLIERYEKPGRRHSGDRRAA